jgi:CRP/FNR family transcriptional regulator
MNPLDSASFGPTEATVCAKCGSRAVGLCQPLDAAALDELAHETSRFTLPARSAVFREGDPADAVVMVMQGTVKLTRLLADGRQQVLGFRFAGDVLGFTSGAAFTCEAETLTEGQFCRIDRRRLEPALKRLPVLNRRLLDLCAEELAAAQDQLVSLGRRTAEERVAHFLATLAAAQRRRGIPCDVLAVPMTRAEIGDHLGLALETVSRVVSALKRQQILREAVPHRLEIIDLAALEQRAEGFEAWGRSP